jgi:hypothetical protein
MSKETVNDGVTGIEGEAANLSLTNIVELKRALNQLLKAVR